MEIKEMPLSEKYEMLYDHIIQNNVLTMAFLKKKGLTDEFMDYSVAFTKKMLPTLRGSAFKIMKTLSPGRAFSQIVENMIKTFQPYEPVSNFEIVSLSDQEAAIKLKDSVQYKKFRNLLQKSGIELEVKDFVEYLIKANKEVLKDFGIDISAKIEKGEEEVTAIIKLQK